MNDTILVINAGSSSLKFSIHLALPGGEIGLDARGHIEGIGTAPRFMVWDAEGSMLAEQGWADDPGRGHEPFIDHLLTWITDRMDGTGPKAVGHRVVHGGPDFAQPVRIDDAVMANLEALSPLAPLHQPVNLAAIRAVAAVHAEVPQVACFDTAFHRGRPDVADRFALPADLYDLGVRRYGFHGLSYEYIAHALKDVAPQIADGRVVVAHLGNGASMCAIHGGHSVETTMGFTALEGLAMGTRCGALDPGVILYLIGERGMSAEEVEDLLYHRSGLLGVSGISSDVRELLASESRAARAALDLFIYRITRELGALAGAMGGLDGIVFTAGIGENSAAIRARVCVGARWMGVDLDEEANRRGGPHITTNTSDVSAWVVPTNEEHMIAQHTLAAIRRT